MSSDLLSQDDIDNLIRSESAGVGGMGGGAINYDALKKPLSIVAEQISTVLLTVLGKEISASVGKIGPADEGKLTAQFGAESVLLRADLFQKVSGSFFFAWNKKDVAVLADLMMMGDGSAPYEEDHKDAVVELTNQVLGAVVSTFGTTFDSQVTTATPVIEDFSLSGNGLNVSEAVMAEMTMKIEDIRDVKFAMLLPPNTASDLISISSGGAATAAMASAGRGSMGGGSGLDGFDFSDLGSGASAMPLQNFSQPSGHLANDKSSQFSSTGNPQMDMLLDVTLQVAIELGRTDMSIKKILELGPGSIIELNRMAGEPVDLLVNDKVIAKGEVVVVDENFGIRIVKLVSPEERLKNLR